MHRMDGAPHYKVDLDRHLDVAAPDKQLGFADGVGRRDMHPKAVCLKVADGFSIRRVDTREGFGA